MKRPLGLIALVYGCGLIIGEFLQPSLLLLFPLSFALAIAAFVSERARPLLIWPLLVCVGWTNLVAQTVPVSPHDVRTLFSEAPEEVTVRGILVATPSRRVTVRNGREFIRTVAELQLTDLVRFDTAQPVVGTVLVSTPAAIPEQFFGGQKVELQGILLPPPPPAAPGLFDYRTYLRRQGIYYQLKALSADDWKLLSSGRSPPRSDRFIAWAKAGLAQGLPVEDETLRLTRAMVLGLRTELPNETYAPFVLSGTMHIFAISGLHITLLSGILVTILRAFRCSRLWCGLLVIPLIWFYTAATGWQSSAVRSTIMMSIIVGGWSLHRPPDLLNSLSGAAFIILLWEPQQLFQAGFQLSFFVVASIALLLPPLQTICDRLLQHDPLLPIQLIPRWRRWINSPLRWLTLTTATSLAAWAGSLPLTAFYFHVLSPVTLLANIAIVPLAGAALSSSLGSLVTSAWFPWAAELFNHAGWFWMKLMIEISHRAAALPGACSYVQPPTLLDFTLYYGLLFALLSGLPGSPRGRRWILVLILTSMAIYGGRWSHARKIHRLSILPLSGGSAVFSDAPGGRNDLLIDCGNANAVEFVTRPFLRAQGVDRLPWMILTHGDVRYVGGAESLLDVIPVGQVATSSVKFRSAQYQNAVAAVEAKPERRLIVHQGREVAGWTVLHPASNDRFARADDNALVLAQQIHGTRVLMLSDLGRLGQDALLERGGNLKADIVIAGLPEQSEPLSSALLDAIQPALIVITDSEYPATRRASPKLRERLARREVRVIYTREAGSITLTFTRAGWELRSLRDTD